LNAIKTSLKAALITFLFGLIASSSAVAQYISISPASLVFSYNTATGTLPASQSATIVSCTDATCAAAGTPVTIETQTQSYFPGQPQGWITVYPIPPTVSTPATVVVYMTPSILATLPAGNYSASIQYSYDGTQAPSSQNTIAVFLTVSSGSGGSGGGGTPSTETIAASPASLAYSYSIGGSVPAAQSLAISTSDNANYTASALTNDGAQWLSISPASGATPGTMSVSVNPAGLNAGSYNGTITISGPNSVTQVSVSLTVGGGGITVSPASLTFNVPQNYGFGAPQYLQVTTAAPAPFQAQATSDFNWLVVDLTQGTTPATIPIRANDSSLAQGSYSGTVTVQTSPANAQQIPVSLTVGPPATLQLAPSSLSFSYMIGNAAPAAQTVAVKSLTGSPQAFSATATTTDGASWLVATPTSPAPGQVSISINPGTLTPGAYSGVVNVTPSATGASPQPILVGLTVLPAPTPTVLSVNSSASYASGTVAPGEFVTLFGSALGPATGVSPTPGTAPKTLGGTVVTFDGIAAPILYASATQTSVQVPYGISLPQTAMQVQRNAVASAAATVASVPAYPAFFTVNQTGKGQIAALNYPSYTQNSASNPAPRGSTIILYGTGEGITNPVSVEGTITPGLTPLPQPLYPVFVSFAGVTGTVSYAGETPSALAGLMQINAVIPLNAPVGPSVSVLVTINGQTSPGGVTIAVQ
jgi:uncharacterized protein (TIGR03437 family)